MKSKIKDKSLNLPPPYPSLPKRGGRGEFVDEQG